MNRITPLLLAFALLPALAATCNIPATQKSPSGPWVGEVTNDGSGVVSDSLVRGEITDATGRVQSIAVPTCPTRLAPGDTATWEIFADGFGLVPPLSGTFRHESTPLDLGVLATGLTARVDATDPAPKAAAVTITNRSRDTIGGITICASMRDASGALIEVGNTRVVPSQLAPGASTTAVLYFASMPADVTFELRPQGQKLCCGLVALPPESFRTTAVTIDNVNNAAGIVAEVANTSGFDLVDMEMSVNVAGDPFSRVDYHAPGCHGAIPKGERGPWFRILRIPEDIDAPRDLRLEVRIAGRASEYPLLTLRGDNLEINDETRDAKAVIRNSTGSWLRIMGTCFNVRDDAGQLLGTSGTAPLYSLLAPGASFIAEGQLYPARDDGNEVIAIAQKLPAEPTPLYRP